MNWAQSIEQAYKRHLAHHQFLAGRVQQFETVRRLIGEIQEKGTYPETPEQRTTWAQTLTTFKKLEQEEVKEFENLKAASLALFDAEKEFKELTAAEKKELDGYYQTALKSLEGNSRMAIGAAAARLQLYKIGDYFAHKETAQFLGGTAPVAAARRRNAKLFSPVWVPLATCARKVGISRNTVSAWYAEGFQIVQGEGGRPEKVPLKRHPGTNRVNLTLVEYVASQKRQMVSPGKPLNRGGGHLVAADLALKNDSPLKREAASALRALAAIEKVHSPALLEEIRTRIKRRLRARKKQSAKRQRGRMALKEAVEVEQMQKLRGYHSVPIRN